MNRETKIMNMGGRDEILLERKTTILMIPKISLEVTSTSLINPYLKRVSICRRWIIFIYAQRFNVCRRLRGDERLKEDCMVSRIRRPEVRDKLRS
jgi:hypothetical protein